MLVLAGVATDYVAAELYKAFLHFAAKLIPRAARVRPGRDSQISSPVFLVQSRTENPAALLVVWNTHRYGFRRTTARSVLTPDRYRVDTPGPVTRSFRTQENMVVIHYLPIG